MAGLDALNPISAVIGGAGDLFKLVYGISQMFHGQHKLNQLEQNRPDYNIPQEIFNNQSAAGQYGSQGFGNNIENMFADQNNAGLGSSISAIEKGGGNLGDINKSFSSAQDSFKNFLMQDYAQKEQNRGLLTQANKDVAEQKLSKQDWEKFIPFQQDWTRFTNQTNSGATNAYNGSQDLSALTQLFNLLGGGGGGNSNSRSNGNYYGGAGGGM